MTCSRTPGTLRRDGRTRFHLARLSLAALAAFVWWPGSSLAAGICGTWNLTPTPDVGNSVTRLTSVTALSPSDAWSVGYWRDEPSGIGSLAIHWDGSQWGAVDLPNTSHLGTQPQTLGVDHAPNGDVWIAGYLSTSYPTNNLPLVIRRQGGDWDYVDTVTLRPQTEYPYAARGGFAYGIDVLNENDAWAVGLANGFGDGQTSSVPMALHWDGEEWTDVPVPIISNRHHELSDVVAIASDDVWAVGDYRFIAGTFRGVTYHWDGEEWTHVYSPIEEISQSGLEDVAATGPNDVWALGGSADQIVLMHWDGTAWSLMEPPPHSVGGTLAAIAPDDLWVSGWNGFWHWDGVEWTEVPSTVPGATYVIRGGAMEVVGSCDIWSVGFSTLSDGITSSSLAERLQTSLVAVDEPAAPQAAVKLAFANPYLPGGPIHLALPEATAPGFVTLHDIHGRALRRAEVDAASLRRGFVWTWDGRTDGGEPVAAGVYLLRVESHRHAASGKLVVR